MNFTIALVQFSPQRENVSANIRSVQKLLHGIQADLIVLPELANSGYLYPSTQDLEPFSETSNGEGPFLSAIRDLSEETGGMIITGYAEKSVGALYNSAAAVTPNGVVENYRKIHLYNTEKLLFASGNSGFKVFSWRNIKIGMMICFDWIFPEAARTLTLKGAQIIAHPANLVLPYCQDAMITRSIENRIFTITANRIGREALADQKLTFTGGSQITNPRGEILFRGPKNKATVHVTDIDPDLALSKTISSKNDILEDRHPNQYIN